MANKHPHPVRNGIIVTVGGGLILSAIPQSRGFLVEAMSWAWAGVSWIWAALISHYSIPGWVFLIVGLFALVGLVGLCVVLRPQNEPAYRSYTEDMLYGAKWCWSWTGSHISNLWCFCPDCDAQLVPSGHYSLQKKRTSYANGVLLMGQTISPDHKAELSRQWKVISTMRWVQQKGRFYEELELVKMLPHQVVDIRPQWSGYLLVPYVLTHPVGRDPSIEGLRWSCSGFHLRSICPQVQQQTGRVQAFSTRSWTPVKKTGPAILPPATVFRPRLSNYIIMQVLLCAYASARAYRDGRRMGERLEAIARSWGSMEGGDVEKTERAPSMDPEAIGPLLLDIRAAGPTEEEGPDMSDKASVLEGIQKAIDMVSALCAGKQNGYCRYPLSRNVTLIG